MTLQFIGPVTEGQRELLEAANTTVLIRAVEDSNDEHIEALNDLVSELMAYAGIRDDGSVQPRHCDECGEVELSLNEDDLCAECAEEAAE